ncbi:TPA: acid phosphatase [bacterium]|nr:acid phosphatase [bacterium]
MLEILQNPILWATFWAWFIAQSLKFLIYGVRNRRINFRIFVGYGGMPSAHSATVISLATAVGRYEGWTSSLFAVIFIMAIIIITDAVVVRRAAGQQASVLNRMLDDFYREGKIGEARLKEFLGHTPIEVIVGGILGYLVAICLVRSNAGV